MIGILSAIAIPQFKQYQERAQAAKLEQALKQCEPILQQGKVLADDYLQANGNYPCSSAELAFQEFDNYAAQMGWESEVNCEDRYLAYFYDLDGKRHYKGILLDDAEIQEGVLE